MKAFLCSLLVSSSLLAGPKVAFVVGEKAHPLDRAAAEQLAVDFKALFDAETSVLTAPPAGKEVSLVLVGSPASNPAIPKQSWPALSEQGHVVKSTPQGLIVGGGSPSATLWAAAELAHHFGIRHLVHGDVLPIIKPAFKIEGLDMVLEPKISQRGWSMFNGIATGAESWGRDEHRALLKQLVKLKFTHVLLPVRLTPPASMAVDGDTAGRKAFGGAKKFPSGDPVPDVSADAKAMGLGVVPMEFVTLPLGARAPSVLPQAMLANLDRRLHTQIKFKQPRFMAGAQIPGDLNAAAYLTSRVCFDDKVTWQQALADFITPMCGDGVVERVQKAFEHLEEATKLIETKDASLGVPNAEVFQRHLASKEVLPAWITEVKTHLVGAMNEMYRANTRAREGGRTYTLHLAKRLEFSVHYLTALEAIYKSHDAAARDESMEAAIEAIYNALNSWSDAARDASDRGGIALLNEHGYKVLLKAVENTN